MTRLPFGLATLATLALSGPAFADVTPAEVWDNQRVLVGAFGGTLNATLREGGTTTEVTGIAARFALPMGSGAVDITFGPIQLVDNGDGSVTMRYPAGSEVTIGFDIPAVGTGSIGLRIEQSYDQVATGTPGDITYTYDAALLTMTFTDFEVSGPGFETPDMETLRSAEIDGQIEIRGNVGTLQVTEGDLLAIRFEGESSGQDYSVNFATADGVSSTQRGSAGRTTFDSTMQLPAGGVGVMALPAALRSGMSIVLNSEVMANSTLQEVMTGGEIMQRSEDYTETIDTRITIDADGLRVFGKAEGFRIDFLQPVLVPFPLQGSIAEASSNLEMPLLTDGGPLPFVFQMGLGGVTLSDEIWSLFDAGNALPRDPATINIDLSGVMGSEIDLLDFAAMAALGADDMPFSIQELTLRDIALSAVGARLDASGDFTFDMGNMETFPGFPAPTGTLNMEMVGVNGLIDTLISAGLLAEADAMGARMGLSLIARPGNEDDVLTSVIEIDGETGAVSANGQRLR